MSEHTNPPSEWGMTLAVKLPYQHGRALDIINSWFGGSISRVDLFVASIPVCIVRDLVGEGLLRPRLLTWELTLKGRQALALRCVGGNHS